MQDDYVNREKEVSSQNHLHISSPLSSLPLREMREIFHCGETHQQSQGAISEGIPANTSPSMPTAQSGMPSPARIPVQRGPPAEGVTTGDRRLSCPSRCLAPACHTWSCPSRDSFVFAFRLVFDVAERCR